MRNLKLVIIILAVALLSSACSISTTSSNQGAVNDDHSVFLSIDHGDGWRPMTSVKTVADRPENISSLNVNMMTMDPNDSLAVYLASYDRGLYYTYNIAEGWNKVETLPQITINDVKVDHKSKCTIYAALVNKLYLTTDCARTWAQIYFDNNTGVTINTIAVDHYNPNNIYIGTSRGEIIKSINRGDSWRTIQRLEDGISKLIISPLDSRSLFVATENNRIFSFISNTITNDNNSTDIDNNFMVESWFDLNDLLADYDLGRNFRDLVISPKDGTVLLATDKAILRSPDEGISWEKLNLITSGDDAAINSLAIDPTNSQNIYYVTDTTFYRTNDGGAAWASKKLPTKRSGKELLIDASNPNVLYLGTVKLK